ncbi:MAG TPA: hypothetical protein VK184_04530 [Nostocaceae cyanobacterium]|nr:hypothetical protein [Nostocaceae cyanobacterium]
MLKFNLPLEPEDFDAKVRQIGNNWLAKNPDVKKIPSYWSNFKGDLADGFKNLCAYSVMYEPVGTVEHYLCCENHRNLAYEWSNYRFSSGWVNSSKGTLDNQVLDPFEVEDDWFEISLPSLQLVLTDAIPPEKRQKAEFTIQRLRLINGKQVMRQREQWYEMYITGLINLEGLEKVAPLIARAVRKSEQI